MPPTSGKILKPDGWGLAQGWHKVRHKVGTGQGRVCEQLTHSNLREHVHSTVIVVRMLALINGSCSSRMGSLRVVCVPHVMSVYHFGLAASRIPPSVPFSYTPSPPSSNLDFPVLQSRFACTRAVLRAFWADTLMQLFSISRRFSVVICSTW